MALRALVSDNAKIWIRGALSKLGVEIASYSGSFAQHRTRLITNGGVSTVWDVGAHVGQYGARLFSKGYRGRIYPSSRVAARSPSFLGERAAIPYGP